MDITRSSMDARSEESLLHYTFEEYKCMNVHYKQLVSANHVALYMCAYQDPCACSRRPLFTSRITCTLYPVCSSLPNYIPSRTPTHRHPILLYSLPLAYKISAPHLGYPFSKAATANVIVNHVTAGACRTSAQLRSRVLLKTSRLCFVYLWAARFAFSGST